MSDETIGIYFRLATAALERADDPSAAAFVRYARTDLTSGAAVMDFHEFVDHLATIRVTTNSAPDALILLRDALRSRLHGLATRGFSRSERVRIEYERAGEPDSLDAPFRERTSAAETDSFHKTRRAIHYDLGADLGCHVLPSFPPKASSIQELMRFPFACSRRAYEHVIVYTQIVCERRHFVGKDLQDLQRWAREFWIIACHRSLPVKMSTDALDAIVEIAFAHTQWPGYREVWTNELFRVRMLLHDARNLERAGSHT